MWKKAPRLIKITKTPLPAAQYSYDTSHPDRTSILCIMYSPLTHHIRKNMYIFQHNEVVHQHKWQKGVERRGCACVCFLSCVCRQTPDSDPIPHLQGINKHACVSGTVDYNQREKGIKFILQLSLIFQDCYCSPCERAWMINLDITSVTILYQDWFVIHLWE